MTLPWKRCSGGIEYCPVREHAPVCKRFLEWLLSACCSQGAAHEVDLTACAAADPESAMLRRYWHAGTRNERVALKHWIANGDKRFHGGTSAHDPRSSVHDHDPTWAEFIEGSEFKWYPGAR